MWSIYLFHSILKLNAGGILAKCSLGKATLDLYMVHICYFLLCGQGLGLDFPNDRIYRDLSQLTSR